MIRRRSYLLPVFCLFSSLLMAQFDSIPIERRNQLLGLPSEARRVDTLNEWARALKSGPQAWQYAQTALAYAQKIAYKEGISDSHMQLGAIALAEQKDGLAERYGRMALRERLGLKLTAKAAGCYTLLGVIQKRKGDYISAANLYRQGLAWMKDQPPHINTAYLYNSLGTASRLSGQYAQADSAFQMALQIYEKLIPNAQNDNKRKEYVAGLASLRMNTGAFLQEQRYQYKEAKALLVESLSDYKLLDKPESVGKCLLLLGNNAYLSRQLDTAKLYYEQGLAMENSIQRNDYWILRKNRGRALLDQQEYKAAWTDFQAALKGFETQADTPKIAEMHLEIGSFFYEQSELDSAVAHYRLALAINRFGDALQKGRLLYFLSDALGQSGDKSAADAYTTQYIQLLNGLNAEESKGAFESLNRYQLDKNRLLMYLVKQDKRTFELYAWGGLSALGLVAFLLYLNARLQRQKRHLAERNAEVARQQEALALQDSKIARQHEQLLIQENLEMLQNRELETQYARLEGQENMQKEIGRELHDGVGATLSTVKLNLPIVEEVLDCIPPGKRAQYVQANVLLDQACAELRRVSHALSAAALDNFGLKTQLEIFAKAVSGSGKLQVELTTHGLTGRFSDNKTELSIYRMTQELVHNAIKHARANSVSIEVNCFEDSVNIIVEDNGQGFDAIAVQEKPGLGLSSLAARVRELNGDFQIDSRPGRGTIVSIDIPLNQ